MEVRFLRAENPMQVIDSTCNHPLGSCRWGSRCCRTINCFIFNELIAEAHNTEAVG